MLDDRQAESGAAGFARATGGYPIEAFGNARQVLRRDAVAGVVHRQHRAVDAIDDLARKTNADAAAGGRVAHRIADQVRERAVQFLGRADQVGSGHILDLDPVAALAQRIAFALQRPQQRMHRHGFLGQHFLRFQPRQGQQVFDDLRHPLRLPAHLVEHRRPLRHVGRIEHFEITMDHGQRRAQFVRNIGDEIAANLFEVHQLADVARDQQPLLFGIRNQPQVQADVRVVRRRRVDHRFGVLAGGHPQRDRQRPQQFGDRRVVVARITQPEQAFGGIVEPGHALAAAIDDHHAIGQHGGGGAVRAQHVEQAALAVAHVVLASMQQAFHFRPHAVAARGLQAPAAGQSRQQSPQPPVMPRDHAHRHQRQRQPGASDRPSDYQCGEIQCDQLSDRALPGCAGEQRHIQ